MKSNYTSLLATVSTLLEQTEDLEALNAIEELVAKRIHVVSCSEESDSGGTNVKKKKKKKRKKGSVSKVCDSTNVVKDVFRNYVKYIPEIEITEQSFKLLFEELKSIKFCNNIKAAQYLWICNNNINYKFGKHDLPPNKFTEFPTIILVMEQIARMNNCKLDSCLVSYYSSGKVTCPPHADDEPIIDQTNSICNLSVGSQRVIQFSNLQNEPVGQLDMAPGSLIVMLPGCQDNLLHEVLPSGSDDWRICLSFRNTSPGTLLNLSSSSSNNTSVCGDAPDTSQLRVKLDGIVTSDGYQDPPSHRDKVLYDDKVKKHLIIGDSLTKGIALPNTVTLSKGGGQTKDILELLRTSHGVVEEADYEGIESVTLCVGTNSLCNLSIPLLVIMSEYEELIKELSCIFPNAKIGMLNVLPRRYNHMMQLIRIKSFNNYLYDLEFRYGSVFLINLYWEFLTRDGHLNRKLFYPVDMLHLSDEGKTLVKDAISIFQTP